MLMLPVDIFPNPFHLGQLDDTILSQIIPAAQGTPLEAYTS